MRTHILHMHKAQNSLGTPAGKSHRTWRVYRPRRLAREGGGSAAARVARLREYHVFDQHAEARAGTRSLHREVPFPPHRDFRVFVGGWKCWVRKELFNFLECPGGACVSHGLWNSQFCRIGGPNSKICRIHRSGGNSVESRCSEGRISRSRKNFTLGASVDTQLRSLHRLREWQPRR